jgi:beta-glucosidase
LPWNGELIVTSRITNTGKVAGEEVVQLYIHDRVASITRPVRELKGFRKVRLEPGASTDVSFTLSRKDLEFVASDLRWVSEPGAFDVWVAPSASTGSPKSFRLQLGTRE